MGTIDPSILLIVSTIVFFTALNYRGSLKSVLKHFQNEMDLASEKSREWDRANPTFIEKDLGDIGVQSVLNPTKEPAEIKDARSRFNQMKNLRGRVESVRTVGFFLMLLSIVVILKVIIFR